MLTNFTITIVGAYLAIVLLVFFFQSRLIYFPITTQNLPTSPEQIGLDYTSVNLTTKDKETIHGWFIPQPNHKGTILFFHGNAGNIAHRLSYLPMFQQLGYQVLMIDYRGYGLSTGTPSEQGTYLDAEAAWQYLTETQDIPSSQIILYGESLGGPIAAWLATQVNAGGLILASTFTSIPDIAETVYPFLPVRLMARIKYNTQESLTASSQPTLIMHSPEDEIVPFTHGQKLFQVAPEPKQLLQLRNGHNNGFVFQRDEWIAELGQFLQTAILYQQHKSRE